MAIYVITNALVLVNAIDLSDHCSKATCEDNRDEVDVTAFSAGGYKMMTKGLGEASITLDFFQDFAASKVHATLQPLIGSSKRRPGGWRGSSPSVRRSPAGSPRR